jgi:hypothetical protein
MHTENLATQRCRNAIRRATVLGALTATTTLAAVCLASAAPAAAATPRVLAAPGNLFALTGPGPDGALWALTGTNDKKTVSQINVATGKTLFTEGVSPYADDIALSADGSTLAVGTVGGAASKPAVVLYSGTTGRFRTAALSPDTVARVASNALGTTVYALRVGATATSTYLLGTSNGLGFNLPFTGQAVDLAPGPNNTTFVLQPDGTVSSLAFPSLAYTPLVSTGSAARALAVTPDSSVLFVLHPAAKHGASASVSVVNATTHLVEKTITVPSACVDIALSPSGTILYEGLRASAISLIKPIAVP